MSNYSLTMAQKRKIGILFPNQLFETHLILEKVNLIYLVEEYLFFRQYNFHKQKIAFHRATMKYYENYLKNKKIAVRYISSLNKESDVRVLLHNLGKSDSPDEVHYIDPTDNWLTKRLTEFNTKHKIDLVRYDNPSFLNTTSTSNPFFRPSKKSFFQTSFYKDQRIKHSVLIDTKNNPVGGQWTYDSENRKRYPKGKVAPPIALPKQNKYWEEAVIYTKEHFPDNLGSISDSPRYPTSHGEAEVWLQEFLNNRFEHFGHYEDAIVSSEKVLHHSVLSPLLNIGLISPGQVLTTSLDCAALNNIPLNSTEGFVRQLIGWREFIRGMYESKGSYARTKNYWGFSRKIPDSFYNGTTGIEPIDHVIKVVLETGYCHHIERLMVLGNFMLLCEFDPNEVYKWFMELFIDSYDWVMVPNVYGMSQFADGGLFATKPYISGSNYLKKMSNYPNGEWQAIWDGLFWRFIHQHSQFFNSNPRMAMLVRTFERMDKHKQQAHLEQAENYLNQLDDK
jgi:deoxyribodipyrimidine photolyase-related protein